MRKKRVFRRRHVRKFRRINPRYDGSMAVKCHQVYQISPTVATPNQGDLSINWGSSITTANNQYARLADNDEFQQLRNIYDFYKVVGLKIKILPICEVTSTFSSNLQEIILVSDASSLLDATASTNHLLSEPDYKVYSQRTNIINKYVGVGKFYFKTQNLKYQPIGTPYPTASTLVRCIAGGYTNGNVMAKVFVTWYVKFKCITLP